MLAKGRRHGIVWVSGLGFRVHDAGFRVEDLGVRA